ncbi:hypothetical protein F5B21DRAFT_505690 [Xylaria acuta]|nr:hypothetical protein F5B21DRAFT_505690 [Xylaria acuta]
MASPKTQAICAAEALQITNSFEQESSPDSSDAQPVTPEHGQTANWSGFGQPTPGISPESISAVPGLRKQASRASIGESARYQGHQPMKRSDRTTYAVQQFHFIFHCEPDLAVALVTGRECVYLSHFSQKIAYNAAAITGEDLGHYVRAYEQSGAPRCAFETYRAFEEDAQELWDLVSANGKLSVPALSLSGERSRHRDTAESTFAEVHQAGTYEVAFVPDAAHYIAE